jgi:hypothetical protein
VSAAVIVVVALVASSSTGSHRVEVTATTTTVGRTTTTFSYNEFKSLVASGVNARIKVHFESRAESDYTLAQDGKGRSSVDDGFATYFRAGTTYVICQHPEMTCDTAPSRAIGSHIYPLNSFRDAGSTFVPSGRNITRRVIAGRQALCSTTVQDDTGRHVAESFGLPNVTDVSDCYDEASGFVLGVVMVSNGKEEWWMRATKVSKPTRADLYAPE